MTTSAANADNRSMDAEGHFDFACHLTRNVDDEMTLDKAREIPLHDMNQAELTVVILHDPDLNERRTALRLLKLEILLDAETRILTSLAKARKAP